MKRKKKEMWENVKVGLLLRTEISTSFFFLFSVLLPSFCTTKHSRKLTLNSALIFSRRSHDFSAYTFFFRHSNIFFSYASAFWGCLRGTSFFFWIGLDLNATWPHVLWASSASWSAFLFYYNAKGRHFGLNELEDISKRAKCRQNRVGANSSIICFMYTTDVVATAPIYGLYRFKGLQTPDA